ncbi:hypothetical protein ACVXG9_24490 [Escherichia coli]
MQLIEHIATLHLITKLSIMKTISSLSRFDEYLDDTFMLFSSYGINMQDFRNGGSQVIDYSVVLSMRRRESCEFILLELLQPWVEVCPKNL